MPKPHTKFEKRYELGDVLGAGGFATVYHATDLMLDREVAIKILRPDNEGYAPDIEARFKREVRIIANLTDQHTVTMFEFGCSENGLLFMVFEYVAGRDLAELIRGAGSLDQRATIRIARQVLLSLREAHDTGLLHRDIKPENIRIYEYLGDPLCVKVLDFGIARLASRGPEAITRTGGVVGTPLYMAPEQTLGAELSPSSDLYSLALVMYEMLSGSGSLSHVNQPSEQLKRLRHSRALELPRSVAVDAGFRAVMERMLCVDAAARFQTADEVLEQLHVDLNEESEGDYSLDATEGFVAQDPASNPVVEQPPMITKGPTQVEPVMLPWHIAALGGVLLLICGVFVVMAGRSDPPPVRSATLPQVTARPTEVVVSEQSRDEGLPLLAGSKRGCRGAMPTIGREQHRLLTSGLESYDEWMTFVPKSYEPDKRHPVLLLLHSHDQTPEEFFDVTGFETIAEEQGLIVIVPDGGDPAWEVAGLREIKSVMNRTASLLCLDRTRIYAVGYSAGARLVESMPCRYPVSAIATLGYRGKPGVRVCEPERPLPFIHLAGTDDGFNPIGGGRGCGGGKKISFDAKEAMWRNRNHCSKGVTTFGTEGASRCRQWQCEVAFASCRLDCGRIYPSDDVLMPLASNCPGRVATYPVAETVWAFFEEHGVAIPVEP